MKRRDFLRLAACSGGAVLWDWKEAGVLPAKDIYPARKVTWISHAPPGGSFDITARAMAPAMTKYLKQLAPGCKGGDFGVKNEVGAAGLKAFSAIYHADPDGYTIGGMDIAFFTDVVIGKKIDFDVTKFTYLAKLFQSTNKFVLTAKNGFKSWEEAVEAAKKAPLKIAVGQFGRGHHVSGLLLKDTLGLNARLIPSQGTSGAISMLIRGDVQCAIASENAVLSLLRTKELQAILTFQESDKYPGVLSLKDLGYPEMGERANTHHFAIAPPKLPKDVAALLIGALQKTLTDKEFLDWAKGSEYVFTPVYGEEAAKIANLDVQYFQSNAEILKKGLL